MMNRSKHRWQRQFQYSVEFGVPVTLLSSQSRRIIPFARQLSHGLDMRRQTERCRNREWGEKDTCIVKSEGRLG